MKSLSVLTPSFYNKIEGSKKTMFQIDDIQIPIGLIDIDEPKFDAKNDNYSNTVLVKKTGFSLNYRDLGIIEKAWNSIKNTKGLAHYPIGSDFSGQVVDYGKNVSGFKKGDSVIANAAYPYDQNGFLGGIPSNHASKEFEILNYGKLMKIDKNFPIELAVGCMIGTQTGQSMIEKAKIKPSSNVLVTSITSNTSLHLLNLLKEKKCNIYGLSYSGKNIETIKKAFPFIKDIFSFSERNIPEKLYFDVVLDPFSDTHFPKLIKNLNFDCHYVTCGVFNQSTFKVENAKKYNLSIVFAAILMKNIKLIGNCLGSTENLLSGLKQIQNNNSCLVDSIYNENQNIKDFMDKTFKDDQKIGRVIFKY